MEIPITYNLIKWETATFADGSLPHFSIDNYTIKLCFFGLSSVQKITSRLIKVLSLADTLKMNRLAR